MNINNPNIDLKRKALELLARREYAYVELARKLANYSSDQEQIERILDELQAANYLNEQRFIENFIAHKGHKYGSRKLKHLLQQKGSETHLVEQLYRQANIDQLALACHQLRRKYAVAAADAKQQAKYLRFLTSRGFSWEVALQAISKAFGAEDD